ncbi:MAG: mandelate racemase/muconate lactonizing enzyme family protein [Caldilineaceae bacterium]|nr:mandelate racemase/muconate lactonizing enzyme family protein [Caldilineaceae bacterium]
MKITEVEIYEVEYKNTPNWHPVLIRIRTDEGISGVGEVGLAYGSGGSAGAGMVKNLAEAFLIGADPMRIEHLWDTMYRKSFWAQGGGPVVFGGMSAIDHALWDIKGKALGVPVYELLGGRCHDKLLAYANGWYHSYNHPSEWAEPIQKIMADGFKAVKFDPFRMTPDGVLTYPKRALDKVMEDLAVARVAAVREVGGPDFIICVEVHGNLGVTSAIRAGQRLEELNPFFYEEPVDALNVDVMAKVAESVNIPLAAGERLYTRYGFRQYIERQALAILQPDLGLAGGIMEVKKIAAHAETYNIHIQPHNCASPVMTAASVQVDACIPNFIIQETFPYRPAEHYEVVLNPLEKQIVDGYLPIPTEPGLGVELNDDFLKNQPCVRVK